MLLTVHPYSQTILTRLTFNFEDQFNKHSNVYIEYNLTSEHTSQPQLFDIWEQSSVANIFKIILKAA